MTEKLGVLLVDVPEPSMFLYTYIVDERMFGKPVYTTEISDDWEDVIETAYKCTQEEAKNTHSFDGYRWRNYD